MEKITRSIAQGKVKLLLLEKNYDDYSYFDDDSDGDGKAMANDAHETFLDILNF